MVGKASVTKERPQSLARFNDNSLTRDIFTTVSGRVGMIVRTEHRWTAATPNKQSTVEGSDEFPETFQLIRQTTLDQIYPFQSFEYGPVYSTYGFRGTRQQSL